MKTVVLLLTLFVLCFGISTAQITSSGNGNWSDNTKWVGEVVPTSSDDVVINHTVTIDNASCLANNVTINSGKTLRYITTASATLVVNGSLIVNGTFARQNSTTGGNLQHFLTINGDFTGTGLTSTSIRGGSAGSTLSAIDVTFAGSGNSNVTIPVGVELNAVTINKSGAARIILSSNVTQNNNGTNLPAALTLTNGIIQTNSFVWEVKASAAAAFVGGSTNSYIIGSLIRAVSSGSNVSRLFPLGDEEKYRPITVVIPTGEANAPVKCELIDGEANTGSSSFSGGIESVSQNRYYKITNNHSAGLTFSRATIGYNTDDGVIEGSEDLRVSTSIDNRSTWVNQGPTSHTTSLGASPTNIQSDVFGTTISLSAGSLFFASLANATGGDNPMPVELSSFTAKGSSRSAELQWSTATETNNFGFEIERSAERSRSTTDAGVSTSLNAQWAKVGFVDGNGNSNAPKSYSFVDNNLSAGQYQYRLKQINNDGSFKYVGTIETVEVGVAPKVFRLADNYPNPFNPSTTIEFSVPKDGMATLKVYNLVGQEVASLFNGVVQSGTINRVQFDAKNLPSGIYFSKLQSNNQQIVKKMMLMK